MLPGENLAKLFRAAPFASPAEVEAFIAEAGSVAGADLVTVLPLLVELAQRSTPEAHQLRCRAFAILGQAAGGTDLFVPGIRALRIPDQVIRNMLVGLLVHVNDESAHQPLCTLFSAADPAVRAAAADIVKQVGGRSALDLLTARCADSTFTGRIEAMNALVVRAGAHGLPMLKAVMTIGKAIEKIQALRHLASRERFAKDLPGALQVAATGLEDPDDLVVAQAMITVGTLDPDWFWERTETFVKDRGPQVVKAFVQQAAQRPTPAVATFFRHHIRNGAKPLRLMLIEAIEVAASEVLFPILVDALGNRDNATRARAMHAVTELAKTRRIDAARAIVWLLGSRDLNVRRVGSEIANQLGDAGGKLSNRLLKFLRDEDWWVRERVLDALLQMKGKDLTEHIVSGFLNDPSDTVRRFAVSALLRIADPRSLAALVKSAQSDPDWMVAEGALEVIIKIGDVRAVPYLVEMLANRVDLRVAIINALRALRAKEALSVVAELVKDEDSDVRTAALMLLDELDDGTHVLFVQGCETDPSFAVREVAGRVLRRYALEPVVGTENLGEVRSIGSLLAHVVSVEADDLLLEAGKPPYVKRHGKMFALGTVAISGQSIRELLLPHISHDQRVALDESRDIDFSYELSSGERRFRVNVFAQLSGIGAVFRTVTDEVRDLGTLGLPPAVAAFAKLSHGLVLVGGPTGAGKSTTLAALIGHINKHQTRHIITVEDPVEVTHKRNKSLINQREVGSHTRSFASALRATLRQDPDVILIGELRDLESISFAVTAAETGHLVLATVHTTSADASIDRLINAFPSAQQAQVRSMLAESLRGVTCQYLLRSPKGGRSLAVEVMLNNEAIQSLIRKGKTFQIPSVIATSREQGMQLMDGELIRLAKEGLADVSDAYARAIDKRAFESALGLADPDAPPLPLSLRPDVPGKASPIKEKPPTAVRR